MNCSDDISDLDESELQRELEGIQVDSSYAYEDQSLFHDSPEHNKVEEMKQSQSKVLVEQTAFETINQESIEPVEAVVAVAKPPPVRHTQSSRAKSKQVVKSTNTANPKSLTRTASHQSVDPMRVIERSLEWAQDKRSRLLQNQREQHRNETKDCSFRPRVNTSTSSKHFNNISNISSLSIIRERKPAPTEKSGRSENSNMDLNGQVKKTGSLIEKWKEQVQHQSEILKQKLQGVKPSIAVHRPIYRGAPPIRNIRANPICSSIPNDRPYSNNWHVPDRSSPTNRNQLSEYMKLVAVADQLFSQLKQLKESNRLLVARLRSSKQLR